MSNRGQTVCFTGHRQIGEATAAVEARVTELAEGAAVLSDEALSLRGSDVGDSETKVKEWAAKFMDKTQ